MYEKFPIPLISRLEKHYVVTSSIFVNWQKSILEQLEEWVRKFSTCNDYNRSSDFKVEEAFIGYQRDTPAAVILQATKYFHQVAKVENTSDDYLQLKSHLDSISLHELKYQKEGSDYWNKAVLLESQSLLLQTASPDAVARLHESFSADYQMLQSKYFEHMYCPSLQHYLKRQLAQCHGNKSCMMQVTTHSHVLSCNEALEITAPLQVHTEILFLHQFDAEIDFSHKIRSLFQRKPAKENENVLIIINCQSGHQYCDLIACARYRTNDEMVKRFEETKSKSNHRQSLDSCMKSQPIGATHVLFIIYLPRQTPPLSFVGFQGDPWLSAHIDELRETDAEISFFDTFSLPISELFYSPLSFEQQKAQHSHSFGYHKRLHSCVQAAVAKISPQLHGRGIEIVDVLLHLIPKHPPQILDKALFYEALVKHVHSVLKQMEDLLPEMKKWAINEAQNHKSLRQGGTLRSTLIRKIDDVLIPILAHILSFVDQYSNFALYGKGDSNPVTQLWLSVFRDFNVMHFNYGDLANPVNNHLSSQFQCRFPFFWIAKEAIEAIATASGNSDLRVLTDAALDLPIANILKSVQAHDQLLLFTHYLKDFTASMYTSLQADLDYQRIEYKLVSDALSGLVEEKVLKAAANDASLVHRMTFLCIAYRDNKSCLLWFSNLVFCIPEVLSSLHSKPSLQQLVAHAVEETLGLLRFRLLKECNNEWLCMVKMCQVTIESLLAILCPADSTKLRHSWNCIRATQMFMEHIGSGFEDVQGFPLQLFREVSRRPRFAVATTVQAIKDLLKTIESLGSRDLERSCHTFFIEFVSHLCFGQESPSQDLIKLLFDTVFITGPNKHLRTTRQLSYKEVDDKIPVIRSSLLQLLLKHNFESVQKFLQEYFEKSNQLVRTQVTDTHQLYLLCIKCIQDNILAKHEHKTFQEQSSIASDLLEKSFQSLVSYTGTITFNYLQAVAQCRSGLLMARECFIGANCGPTNICLLNAVKKICTNKAINSPTKAEGPNIFMLKVLTRSNNMSILKQVAKKHTWLIPQELQLKEREPVPDPFVTYGSMYCMVRNCVADAVYNSTVKDFEDKCCELKAQEHIFIVLALYEILSTTEQDFSTIFSPTVIAAFTNCKTLNNELRSMTNILLTLKKQSCLSKLQYTSKSLSAILVHTAAVMFSRKSSLLLSPFLIMLTNPASLMNVYLPTMPEDPLTNVQAAMYTNNSGQFYECSNGHRYFVGECGKPMQQSSCPECHEPIGGQNHNFTVQKHDAHSENEKGYLLLRPERRTSDPQPERNLSPIACCLVRIIMHSVLLWACDMDQNISHGVKVLVKQETASAAMQLLLEHLGKDFETLEKALRKTELECAILVHTVLQNILMKDCSKISSSYQLRSSTERSEWENIFCETFIAPILRDMVEQVPKALELIMNDDKKVYGPLMRIIYEKIPVRPNDLCTHAWAYHHNLSLGCLITSFDSQDLHKKCPILHKFLQNEHFLRGSQCIPDIYRLQSLLYSQYNHRLDRTEASKTNIGSFLKQIPAHCSDVKMMLESLNKAWCLARDFLKSKSRLEIKDEYMIQSFTPDVPLEYIIPTNDGAGVCTAALLDLLVRMHNDFIKECRILLQEQDGAMKRELQKVPVQHIQHFHTLDYESQLSSLISSHCEYSLITGKSQNVQYDFFGIEKQLVNQFINGKPLIDLVIPCVVYRKDICSTLNFSKIKERIYPQVALPVHAQLEILGDLNSIPMLKNAVDTLGIVMAYLIAGSGASAEMNLSTYAKPLRIEFCSKIQEHCKLSHVLSLWETISVAIARQHVIREQDPFEGIKFQNMLTPRQKKCLESALRHFKLDHLIGRLYVFITVHIRNVTPQDETTSIVDGIHLFCDISGDEEIPGFDRHFPSDLTLGHAVEVWKLIVQYQNRIEGFKLI